MTPNEFKAALLELGCDAHAADRVSALCIRMWSSYPWMSLDDIFSVALGVLPRVHAKYRTDMNTTFSTYFVTCARNALSSMLRREEKQRKRFEVTGAIDTEVYVEAEEVNYVDIRHILARVLSPLAWRLLQKSLDTAPERPTNRVLSVDLGVSIASVLLLKRELQATALLVLSKEENV